MLKPAFLLLLITVVLNTMGSLLIKKGSSATVSEESIRSAQTLVTHMLSSLDIYVNVYTMTGLAFLGLSFVFFVFILSKVPLSVAQPMLAMSYIPIAIGAYFLFGESITLGKIVGILVIITGVCFVSSEL